MWYRFLAASLVLFNYIWTYIWRNDELFTAMSKTNLNMLTLNQTSQLGFVL